MSTDAHGPPEAGPPRASPPSAGPPSAQFHTQTKVWPARRLAFCVEYDGTDFAGWQVQPAQRTIQGELEAALGAVVGHPVEVQGASRTDAGVHARDQRAAATLHHPIRPDGLVKAVNRRLPSSIAIRDVVEVTADFNPRFGNHGKTYAYRLYFDRRAHPLLDRFAWRVPWPVDADRLMEAAQHCLGRHDFRSFAAADGSHKTTERTLTRIAATTDPQGVLCLWIQGDAFMKQMVRNLVGTWVEVGRGAWPATRIPAILEARDRTHAGPTAAARGLTLEQVHDTPMGAQD